MSSVGPAVSRSWRSRRRPVPARGAFNAVASKTLRVLDRHLRDHLLPDVVELTTRDGEAYPLRPLDGWTPSSDR